MHPDDTAPKEELVPLDDSPLLENSWVSGDKTGQRLTCRYFHRTRDNAVVAHVHFGPRAEGPPGHAHGGSMASVLDEIMGMACWLSGHMVVAAKLSTDFKKVLPLGTHATAEAWVHEADGRKVVTRGRLTSPDGTLHCEAEGLFIAMDEQRMLKLLKR